MAVSRAARLAPVVEMAEQAEKTAVQRLGYFQGQVKVAESKLADLDAFRLDYQEQWIVRGSDGVSGQWLLGYHGFLAQLDTAIDQQRQSLVWHQNNLIKARDAWQQAFAKVEGLRKLVQRYREEAQRLEDKREQRLLDELSQRLPRHDPLE
ncbi:MULTISPECIES: flagellar export protein FliJ [Pseudomonas]|jgi:flagellar FliJ protein|uniref:Flagellar FliJ protein n=2 Tax=Pseudomonas fluorescens group TaxID=136843 RepID=A0A2A2PH61_9PSED|nr:MULTISPECIES: flagellar export protein FliJ [Pseudomonas]MBA5982646.1 flagella biosynthesis chaperone FliJ [Pseudomonas sp. MD195_PC81_125]PAW50280.1 flagella biosynthesis chaperone FliJ [Pseudomonas moraviensis]PAW54787.1 flagella biosynthesis chaperone FliJ [Pseudomonas moraviensis]QXE09019.1 flagella biosynthesis chaperone FliJ [Pseudomonas sp. AN-B15]ULN82841.1 flagella biosynthesis chaperone FliJ [Pseudomonas sp. Y5-11]